MREDGGRALLGLPVRVGGAGVGTVVAVWVDAAGTAVGIEVGGSRPRDAWFVPLRAASVHDGSVTARSHALLDAFVTGPGGRRIAASRPRYVSRGVTVGRTPDERR